MEKTLQNETTTQGGADQPELLRQKALEFFDANAARIERAWLREAND
ncbi:hypothetical protein [Thalassovita aquimarina]|uniref:Uncharacterized protein n=1 Tax=Thalassovita aquimarina TaxID=2785917 RepID=A0ABS5HXJ8_9RHOB|nr:hypothetical protein [Thalassovita aquimarina]MBR9653283.1 hypothetical protein [Thalassovita aquimarina]